MVHVAAVATSVSATEEFTAALVALRTGHNKEAFTRLFDYYAPRAKAFLIRQGADVMTAEELAQEAMSIMWQKAALFDPSKASAGTWIFTIVRNLRIDALRRTWRPELDPRDPTLVPDPPLAPDKIFENVETQIRVQTALQELSRDQATVIRLAFFEDKAHSQIAEELAVPLGTVKSRLRLAMRRLASLLGGDVYGA